MNTLSHTRLAPPLSEILQAGTLCTFRTLKTVFFANVGRLSTSLDPMYIRTTEFFAPLFGSIIANNFMISLRRAMYSQQHIFCVALIKLCSKRGQGFVLGHSFSLCLFLRRKLCRKPLLGTLYRKPQKMCKSILLWQQQCDTYHSNRSTSVRPFCTKQGWFLMCKFANNTKRYLFQNIRQEMGSANVYFAIWFCSQPQGSRNSLISCRKKGALLSEILERPDFPLLSWSQGHRLNGLCKKSYRFNN